MSRVCPPTWILSSVRPHGHHPSDYAGLRKYPRFIKTTATERQPRFRQQMKAMSGLAGTNRPLSSPKKLIVCCDGTWRNSDGGWMTGSTIAHLLWSSPSLGTPTNITRLTRAIKPINDQLGENQGCPQIVLYQAGVGSVGNILQHLTGGALGAGLGENIREAYSFLATNYLENDQIVLLGFSRGAYTARAVGGFMSDIGLLTRDGLNHFYDIYTDWINTGKANYEPRLAANDPNFHIKAPATDYQQYLNQYHAELRRLGYTTARRVKIKAIGVFETVGALGIPVLPFLQLFGFPPALHSYRFFDTRLGSSVENAFQALALDEHRATYAPTVWEKHQDDTVNLKQVWFPGVHSDVGGGYSDQGLADISLAWMMSELAPYIDFYPDYIAKQHALNQTYLRQKKAPPTGLLWGASQLVDSARGLRGLAGTSWRTPGRYFQVDRKTDIVIKSKPLQETHEQIHFSVRSRESTGGLDSSDHVSPYKPKAMEGYVLTNPEAQLGEAQWIYEGNDEQFRGKVLSEPELGIYEKEIFRNHIKTQPA